jgi:ubiquinol-cytochrome c reductase cytochrome b subunit
MAEEIPRQSQATESWLARHTTLGTIAQSLFDQPSRGVEAWARTTAGVVAMLLALQIVTGALLAFYYVPSIESAHTTVAYVEKIVPAGSWIRALHHYGSQWLTLFLVLHLAQMFWRAAYQSQPVAWCASVVLLALVLANGATGYSLPWDMRAFYGTRVTEGITSGLPFIGSTARRWLLGGAEISSLTLPRLSALHLLIVPAFILLLITARLFILRERKMSNVTTEFPTPKLQTQNWRRKQFTRHAVSATLVFLALALYALKFPTPLGPGADTPAPTYLPRPGAQFLWLFQMLKYLPGRVASSVALALPSLIFAGLAALPFLDHTPLRKIIPHTRRKIGSLIFALSLLLFASLTALAYIEDARDPHVRAQLAKQATEEAAFRAAPFEPLHPGTNAPDTEAAGKPTNTGATSNAQTSSPSSTTSSAPDSYIKNCSSCHGTHGQGASIFPKLTGVSTKPRRTVEDIIGLLNDPLAYGIDPPMKSFADKLTDNEKREIAEWVVTLKKK